MEGPRGDKSLKERADGGVEKGDGTGDKNKIKEKRERAKVNEEPPERLGR